MDRGWPHNFERKIAIRSKIHRRKATPLKQNNEEEKEILPFVTQYKPLVSIIKKSFNEKVYNLIQNQQLPCQIFKEPLNPRMYTQNHTPTMVQEEDRWNLSPEFLTCCSISKRFCLHWKAFDLLNKMRYIL